MLKIHHLRIGRSIFMVWLMEELELEYEVIEYLRDAETMLAPPELKNIHPLGKSPVIDDDGLIISESGAITSYLLEKHDKDNKFSPPRSDLAAWAKYTQWLHYAEGSVFSPLMLKMIALRGVSELDAAADPGIALHYGHISQQLDSNDYILGDSLSGADFGIAFTVYMGAALGQLEGHDTLAAYLQRCTSRPAYQRAVERAVE
jgi:glutathione S-transferase